MKSEALEFLNWRTCRQIEALKKGYRRAQNAKPQNEEVLARYRAMIRVLQEVLLDIRHAWDHSASQLKSLRESWL